MKNKEFTIPELPKFLMSPDAIMRGLYLIHVKPFALIWGCQDMPAKLFIIEGEQSEEILREANLAICAKLLNVDYNTVVDMCYDFDFA